MEITQSSSELFVIQFVEGRKVKVSPEALNKQEREEARKYYLQKIGRKNDEREALIAKLKPALDLVNEFYAKFGDAKKEYYTLENQVKMVNDSVASFKRVLNALEKQDVIEEGLSFVLDKLEEAQDSEEGHVPPVTKMLQELREGGEAPLL